MNSAPTSPPMFSVIMPLYNHAAFVESAVRSVIAQTCPDWELIVINDGSTDGSEKLVAALAATEPRIRLTSQANAGPGAARAAATVRAAGNWLAFLDSDDLWYPTALADFRDFLRGHPDAQLIYGFRDHLDPDGAIAKSPGKFQDRPTGVLDIFQRMFISHLCVCCRKELLTRAGGYDPALRCVEDYDLYLRIATICPFTPLGKATGLRRRHAGCISTPTGHTRMSEAEVLRRFVEQRGGRDLLGERIICRRLGQLYLSAARRYFREGHYRHSLAAAAMARQYRWTFVGVMIAVCARCLLPFAKPAPRPLPDLSNTQKREGST